MINGIVYKIMNEQTTELNKSKAGCYQLSSFNASAIKYFLFSNFLQASLLKLANKKSNHKVIGFGWSGREDSNLRSLVPQTSTLTGLSYYP